MRRSTSSSARLADEPAIDVAIDPGCEVVADPVAFERVVENLLTNAVKYGRAPIAVRGDCDRLVVEDSGPGVAADFVPHLFERFTRAGGVPRSVAGAGLGLAIARAFATAAGGELTYEPAEPSGSRFVFAFRREAARR